jgi:UDP-glucuronate 4-epimerase
MKILVTGAAGFIGMHTSQVLLARGDQVVGIDNLNDYYDVQLKLDRLARLTPHELPLRQARCGRPGGHGSSSPKKFDRVIHLAAQAGVRYSLVNPRLRREQPGGLHEHPRRLPPQQGAAPGVCQQLQRVWRQHQDAVLRARQRRPSGQHLRRHQEGQRADGPHLQPPLRPADHHGLRFFTVYGPWGRPDMALFLFTKAILEGRPIDVFNHGKMKRDFTFDDIVQGVIRTMDRVAEPDPAYNADLPDPGAAMCPSVCSTSATTTRSS